MERVRKMGNYGTVSVSEILDRYIEEYFIPEECVVAIESVTKRRVEVEDRIVHLECDTLGIVHRTERKKRGVELLHRPKGMRFLLDEEEVGKGHQMIFDDLMNETTAAVPEPNKASKKKESKKESPREEKNPKKAEKKLKEEDFVIKEEAKATNFAEGDAVHFTWDTTTRYSVVMVRGNTVIIQTNSYDQRTVAAADLEKVTE